MRPQLKNKFETYIGSNPLQLKGLIIEILPRVPDNLFNITAPDTSLVPIFICN